MKTRLVILLLLMTLVLGCKSGTDVLPSEIWSSGCVQLAPYQGGYQLTGICCTYVLLPPLKLTRQGSFTVAGSYHSFTGAGFSNVPISITGNLSSDKTTLTVRYSTGTVPEVYILKPGPATVICSCGCD